MSGTKTGMLVRLDNCLGCQACQVACREENGFSYEERWLELIRRKPQRVDGGLRNYHVAAPHLDKCALCVEKDHQPLCVTVCPTKCLYVADKDTLLAVMDAPGRWQLHV